MTAGTSTPYITNRRLQFRGKWLDAGATIEITPEEARSKACAAWITHGWVHELRDGKPVVPEKVEGKRQKVEGGKQTPSAESTGALVAVQMVALDRVRPDPTQPRKDFAPESMQELVDSVREQGVEQAILVRPMSRWRQIVGCVARQWAKHERKEESYGLSVDVFWRDGIKVSVQELISGSAIITRLASEGRCRWNDEAPEGTNGSKGWEPTAGALAPLTGETTLPGEEEWLEIVYGERRWRAAQAAGLTEIPAKVRELTDTEAAEKQAVENLDRADLSPLEEAAQFRKLLDLPGYGMERLETTTGKKRNTIYGKLKLLELPEEVKKAVGSKILPAITAERIGRLEGDVQKIAIKAILHPERHDDAENGKVLSDRQAKEAIERAEKEAAQKRKIEEWKAKAIADGYEWVESESKRYKEICGQWGSEPHPKSGIIALNHRVSGDSQYRSYGEILKLSSVAKHAKNLKPKVAATSRWGHEVFYWYSLAEIKAVLKAANWSLPKKKADPSIARRKARDKIMVEALDRAAEHVRLRSQLFCPRVAQTPDALAMWRALARCAVNDAGWNSLQDFVRRRGLEPVMANVARKKEPDYPKTVKQYLVNRTAGEYAGIVAELMLIKNAWWSGSSQFNDGFKESAADWGLDLKRLVLTPASADSQAEDEGDDDDEEEASAGARTPAKVEGRRQKARKAEVAA